MYLILIHNLVCALCIVNIEFRLERKLELSHRNAEALKAYAHCTWNFFVPYLNNNNLFYCTIYNGVKNRDRLLLPYYYYQLLLLLPYSVSEFPVSLFFFLLYISSFSIPRVYQSRLWLSSFYSIFPNIVSFKCGVVVREFSHQLCHLS